MEQTVRVFLVDDHALFRRGLRALLLQDGRFSVVGEAGDVSEALRVLPGLVPDVVLLDNHMPGVRGVEAVPSIKEIAGDVRVLMLTVSEDSDDLALALKSGADGYLLKTVDSEQLMQSIMAVLEGESIVSPEMMSKLVRAFRQEVSVARASVPVELQVTTPAPAAAPRKAAERDSTVAEGLSPRESEILGLVAKGKSNKVIARELDIAETTVKNHVQHVLRKLGLTSRVQAAVYATAKALP